MADENQVMIYTAADSAQATALVNVLAGQGVWSMVVNETLQSGAGELMGNRALPRIVVREGDAQRGHDIAAWFEQQVFKNAQYEQYESDGEEGEPQVTVNVWPTCPDCHEPRHTTCEVCGTAGSDFPPADTEFSPLLADGAEEEEGQGGPPLALICPTCDEPFVPEFLRRCQWCGHDFGEGLETDVRPESALANSAAQIDTNSRVTVVAIGLFVVVVALAIFFAVVMGR